MDKHNKSLEIDLRNLVTNGSVKRQYQSVNKKNTENRTESSTRPETNQKGGGGRENMGFSRRGRNRLDFSNATELALSRGRESGRKKPRFLSSA